MSDTDINRDMSNLELIGWVLVLLVLPSLCIIFGDTP